MKPRTTLICAGLLAISSSTGAQSPRQAPTPRPEHQKLEYFVGDWKTEAETKSGAWGSGGVFTSNDHAEWIDGKFFVITHAATTSPWGTFEQISVLGYDAQRQAYTFNSFNSAGVQTTATGTLENDTWTWKSAYPAGERTYYSKHTIRMLSAVAYTFKFESSTDGDVWSTVIEGRTTRTK